MIFMVMWIKEAGHNYYTQNIASAVGSNPTMTTIMNRNVSYTVAKLTLSLRSSQQTWVRNGEHFAL